jgi:hypothetical protein
MLSEVIFTKNESLRESLLEKTKKWYYNKVGWPAPKPKVPTHPLLSNVAPEPTPERLN